MWVEDVGREEAKNLGLKVEDLVPDTDKNLNSAFSTSVKKMDPEVKKKLLEELRSFKAKDAGEAGRQAALKVRESKGRIFPDS
jgi:hypothetical protein